MGWFKSDPEPEPPQDNSADLAEQVRQSEEAQRRLLEMIQRQQAERN
jgi:hypothetical protein